MKHISLTLALICAFFSASLAQKASAAKDQAYTVQGRTMKNVLESDINVIRLDEGPGQGVAWVNSLEFTEGTIEFDARGRDVLQKSFLGIAFHGLDNEVFETVYFRPFNFQAADPVRKIHAVQYTFEPKFGFQQLRDTQKDKFEAAIKPADTKASEWFHVKVEVKGDKITAYVNGDKEPCLSVTTLNAGGKGKKIGFWVGNSSNGDFANLKIGK